MVCRMRAQYRLSICGHLAAFSNCERRSSKYSLLQYTSSENLETLRQIHETEYIFKDYVIQILVRLADEGEEEAESDT